MSRHFDENRIYLTARALVAISLCLLVVPLRAQGIGPPDLGVFNYVIVGVWLFFWIGVFVYPIAVVVYFIRRQSDAWAEEQDDEFVAPSRGEAILKWSFITHLVLTLANLLVFALQ